MAVKVLDALMVTLPMMKTILGLDVQIGLFDLEKTIGVWYGDTFRMKMEVGEYLNLQKPGHDMILQAMKTGIGNSGILPEYVCGVAVDGIISPVFENGEVVGVISAAVSLKERKEIESAAEKLNCNMTSSQIIVNEIAEGTTGLAEKLENMKKITGGIEELIDKTSVIVKNIQQNANKSDLIALNASIEAARARVANNGFAVIATEMGKLAKINEDSAKKITTHLNDMFDKIENIIHEISTAANISTEQAASMEEMASNLEEITFSANKLEQIATVK